MLHIVDLTPSLPWRPSQADKHFGGTRDELVSDLTDFSNRLWREAGVAVPLPDPAAARWLMAGRILTWAGWAGAVGMVLLATVMFGLAALDMKDAAAWALLATCGAAVLTLAATPGAAITAQAERLLVLTPLDLSSSVASDRAPAAGRWLVVAGQGAIAVVGLLCLAGALWATMSGGGAIRLFGLASVPEVLIVAVLILLVGTAAIILGLVLRRRGLATLQPSTEELRAVDGRRPILLLRSFEDDDESVVTAAGQGFQTSSARFEEALASRFAPFGPWVAIGRPGEALPELGAARAYRSDDEWRDAVAALMREALLIVVIAGSSGGLRWELETIAQAGLMHKLLVLMPPSDRKRRWTALCTALRSVPGFADLPDDPPRGVLALYNPDGATCVALTMLRGWVSDYQTAIHYAIYGLFSQEPD